MITLCGLTKRYGDRTAVDGLTLDIGPGRVTGFLGPNGAGKSTTMRMILGLDHPTSGRALIKGKPYAALRNPLREVGALIDARAVHPGRSARAHLLALAHGAGIPARRVDAVLDAVGLTSVAGKRAGAFSLGMGQRLGVAGALLGDPPVLLFDEPVNGLDPEGVRWIRGLMRSLAEEGRTVFVSSHLMSEMQETADHLVVMGRGRLIADAPIAEVIGAGPLSAVRVRSPQPGVLAGRLESAGYGVERAADDELLVTGGTPAEIGDIAYEAGVRVYALGARPASLEAAYMELTGGDVEYAASAGATAGADRPSARVKRKGWAAWTRG